MEFDRRMNRELLDTPLENAVFAVFDTETSLGSKKGEPGFFDLVEIGVLVFSSLGEVLDKYHSFVKPFFPFNRASCKAMHITEIVLANAPLFPDIAPDIGRVFKGRMVVGQNTQFDVRAVRHAIDIYSKAGSLDEKLIQRLSLSLERPHLDTKLIFSQVFPSEQKRSLDAISRKLGIDPSRTLHSAIEDASLTMEVFRKLLALTQERNTLTLRDLIDFQEGNFGKPKQEPLF